MRLSLQRVTEFIICSFIYSSIPFPWQQHLSVNGEGGEHVAAESSFLARGELTQISPRPPSHRHTKRHPSHRPQLLKITEMFREPSARSGCGQKGRGLQRVFSAYRCVDTLHRHSGNVSVFISPLLPAWGHCSFCPPPSQTTSEVWWRPSAQVSNPRSGKRTTDWTKTDLSSHTCPGAQLVPTTFVFRCRATTCWQMSAYIYPHFPWFIIPPFFLPPVPSLCVHIYHTYTKKHLNSSLLHTHVRKKWNFLSLKNFSTDIIIKITTRGQQSWCSYIISGCNFSPLIS